MQRGTPALHLNEQKRIIDGFNELIADFLLASFSSASSLYNLKFCLAHPCPGRSPFPPSRVYFPQLKGLECWSLLKIQVQAWYGTIQYTVSRYGTVRPPIEVLSSPPPTLLLLTMYTKLHI